MPCHQNALEYVMLLTMLLSLWVVLFPPLVFVLALDPPSLPTISGNATEWLATREANNHRLYMSRDLPFLSPLSDQVVVTQQLHHNGMEHSEFHIKRQKVVLWKIVGPNMICAHKCFLSSFYYFLSTDSIPSLLCCFCVNRQELRVIRAYSRFMWLCIINL
jgi:hypothetical protein